MLHLFEPDLSKCDHAEMACNYNHISEDWFWDLKITEDGRMASVAPVRVEFLRLHRQVKHSPRHCVSCATVKLIAIARCTTIFLRKMWKLRYL